MKAPSASANEQRLAVLAPQGRDARVILQVLHGAAYQAVACATLADLLARLNEGAAAGIVTEEELQGDGLPGLLLWMARQPPWSDFPMLVLATRRSGRRSPRALSTLDRLGNVVLLERPLNAETLVSAARSALRARARQYETRFHLEEQQRVHQENERLYEAESRALRQLAESRDALLAAERRAREQAEQGNRAKDEFLATLSHELRTPLSAILGWVYVLRHRTPSAADLAKGVDVIERNARAQAMLIDELLDMSRIIAGNVRLELQTVSVVPLIESAIASIQPGADAKSIRLERAFDATGSLVLADAQRLQQIVWNLLSNAVKFTAAGGSIGVRVTEAGGMVAIAIEDNGEGIAADFVPFVFDRFRQADGSIARRHGGLGLGLSIVRNLVELHGGTVQAESGGQGLGSTMTVRLPLAPANTAAAAAALQAPSADEPVPTLAGLQLVVVDDEDDSREMIARILREHGAEARTAGSAAEAIEAITAAPADLLVSDIGMPRVDGYELLRRLRRLGHGMPVIALTAFARDEDRHKALRAGFAAHLAKPFEASELVSTVNRSARRPAAALREEEFR